MEYFKEMLSDKTDNSNKDKLFKALSTLKKLKKQEIDVMGFEPMKQLMHKTLNLTPLTTRTHV